MIEPAAGEPEARRYVLRLEVGQFLQNLLLRQPGGEEIEHIRDPDPHPADTWPTSAQRGVEGDAIGELRHNNDPTADASGLPTRSVSKGSNRVARPRAARHPRQLAHSTPDIEAWLASHSEVHFHYTPRSASWLNQVEGYFAAYPDGRERPAWPGITHFRVRATWVRYSDFTQSPPRIVELSAADF